MNKKVIALAVAGALALPLAAKAQTANVTLYGSFRLAFETADRSDFGRDNHIDSWSSRWGIRGTESLGGGLNGIFHMETGVNLDNPGTTFGLREGWVGLQGGFGTVKMGQGLTPYDDVLGMSHLLLANGFEGQTTLGGGSNTTIRQSGNFTSFSNASTTGDAGGNACNSSTNFDARYGNAIEYNSPNMSGLTFATQYAFLGENTKGFKCKGWDSNVKYVNGPIEAGLGYARHIDFANYDGNAWRLHGGYNFGVAKVIGVYERLKYNGSNGSTGSAQTRYYSLGVSAPVGPGTLTAQYHNRNKGAAVGATAVTEIQNGGGKHYTVSYKYGFSKRTYAFGYAAHVKADTNSAISGGPLNGKVTSFGFGLQHNF